MKTDPQLSHTTETHTEPPAEKSLMADVPMRGKVCIPRAMRPAVMVLCVVLTLALVLGAVLILAGGSALWVRERPAASDPADDDRETVKPDGNIPGATYPYADGTAGNALLGLSPSLSTVDSGRIGSAYAAVADLSEGTVVAALNCDQKIYPASMTKVMTLIVAVERLPYEGSLQDTVTVSQEVYDTMVAAGASGVGFDPGETLTVEALLYALMLQSDGMAACELARYIAGSEAAFVALMNEKAADMGLVNTHFENPTGLHHNNHYSTAREVASIMAYAMDMTLCRTVMTAESYVAPFTMATGEARAYTFYNNLLVHQFDRNDPHQPTGLTVIAGKTGYTDESEYCLVTYAETADGRGYVCVTANNTAKYAGCIADYIALYNDAVA